MPFMKKADMLMAAEALGVNIEGLSWPEQQKAVQEALAKSEKDFSFETPKPKPYVPVEKKNGEMNPKEHIIEHAQKMAASAAKAKPVLITHEIPPTPNQLFKVQEDVGEEIQTANVSYLNGMPEMSGDSASATYVVKGRTGRRQIALSTMPHQNAQIVYDPNGRHWLAPIVKDFNGREGYLFNHHKYGGIKPLLIKSGYWEDYKARFNAVNFPQNIWMAGGKFYACDMGLCESIFAEIEKKAKNER
jgi:hypothetical protein